MDKIYSTGEGASSAFLLESGEINYILPDGHKFACSGKNVIFGTAEFLLNWEEKQGSNRMLDLEADSESVIKPVPLSNLQKLIRHYNVGFNICRQLARLLREINSRLEIILSSRTDKEKKSQKCARDYAIMVDKIHEAFKKLRFPFLKTLYDDSANSLTYPFGKCLMRIPEKAVIHLEGESFDNLLRNYPEGAEICHQGEQGDTLFILRNGMLGIYLGELEKPVATVTMAGEVIGEMSLLLNEARSATMKAETPVTVTAVTRQDLQHVTEGKPEFFVELGITLSRRVGQALALLNHLMAASLNTTDPEIPFHDPHREAFRTLERSIKVMLHEHDFPIMKELQEEIRILRNE